MVDTHMQTCSVILLRAEVNISEVCLVLVHGNLQAEL